MDSKHHILNTSFVNKCTSNNLANKISGVRFLAATVRWHSVMQIGLEHTGLQKITLNS